MRTRAAQQPLLLHTRAIAQHVPCRSPPPASGPHKGRRCRCGAEVDALAGSRDSGDMHEATRRVLSVILQRLEGLEGSTKATVIAATNRKQVTGMKVGTTVEKH